MLFRQLPEPYENSSFYIVDLNTTFRCCLLANLATGGASVQIADIARLR